MKIKFKMIDEQDIKIIGVEGDEEKEIGCIFTPSSSGGNILNAIQICGVDEVFDFWGCSRYIKPKDVKQSIIDVLENKKPAYNQAKDIQIMFTMNTEPADYKKRRLEFRHDCLACFNNPCTCENKIDHKVISPYNVKREEQIQDKLKYREGHIPLKEQKEILKKYGGK